MTRVLARPRVATAIVLLVLAFLSTAVTELELPGDGQSVGPEVWAIVALVGCVVIGATALAVALGSWLISAAGRMFGGSADAYEIFTVAAWSSVPEIIALIYRLPVAWHRLTHDIDEHRIVLDESFTLATSGGAGCVGQLAFGTAELAVLMWSVTLLTIGISVAHRFSISRALATLVTVLFLPIVLLIAFAPLAM